VKWLLSNHLISGKITYKNNIALNTFFSDSQKLIVDLVKNWCFDFIVYFSKGDFYGFVAYRIKMWFTDFD